MVAAPAGPLPAAVAAVLEYLRPGLASDHNLVAAVLVAAAEFEPS